MVALFFGLAAVADGGSAAVGLVLDRLAGGDGVVGYFGVGDDVAVAVEDEAPGDAAEVGYLVDAGFKVALQEEVFAGGVGETAHDAFVGVEVADCPGFIEGVFAADKGVVAVVAVGGFCFTGVADAGEVAEVVVAVVDGSAGKVGYGGDVVTAPGEGEDGAVGAVFDGGKLGAVIA